MNISEALAEVLRIVARPDKQTDALLGINRAITFCTLRGEFDRDKIETTIAVDPTLYGDTISLAALVRFRRFTYVRPTTMMQYLRPIAEDQLLTPKGFLQPNRYFLAGQNLTYTLSVLTPTLEIGYLQYAPTLDLVTNTAHWMLDEIPTAIIDLAAAYVFKGIGDDASARFHEGQGMEMYLAFRRDKTQEN